MKIEEITKHELSCLKEALLNHKPQYLGQQRTRSYLLLDIEKLMDVLK